MAMGDGERPVDGRRAMRPRPMRGPGGFTLVEVLVAVVILAIGAAGLIQLLAQAQQQNDRRRGAEVARRIAENEVARARSAGPWNVPATAVSARVDPNGTPDPAGAYRVTVQRDVVCDGPSARPNDTGGAAAACAEGGRSRRSKNCAERSCATITSASSARANCFSAKSR